MKGYQKSNKLNSQARWTDTGVEAERHFNLLHLIHLITYPYMLNQIIQCPIQIFHIISYKNLFDYISTCCEIHHLHLLTQIYFWLLFNCSAILNLHSYLSYFLNWQIVQYDMWYCNLTFTLFDKQVVAVNYLYWLLVISCLN